VGRPLVTLDRVDVRLAGATLLEDVSLEVRAGEGLAVVGPSGSGKSTLLRLVRGDLWPHPASAGRRLFHGADGPSESPIGARERFALVAPETQDAYVRHDWDLAVEAVIRSGFSGEVFPPEAATPAQAARVREVAALLGVEGLLRRSILELSRGEGRRALLARALAPWPDLLVLDEPCEGLDARSREVFLAHVSGILRGGTGVVVATHREEELVPEIERVAEVSDGRVTVRERTATPTLGPSTSPPLRGGYAQDERPSTPVRPEGRPVRPEGSDAAGDAESKDERPSTPVRHERSAGAAGAESKGVAFRASRVTVLVEGRAVLRDLDFVLRHGERVAIVGPNGAGKSTFLRLLAGDEQPATGTIERLDLGPRANALDLRGRIGVVSPELQARHRFDATGEAVVLSGFHGTIGLADEPTAAEREAAREALAGLGIAHLGARHLLTLSYGELRRLLLARALAPAPEVLLLDEPLAGLDAASRQWVLGTVARACDAGAALVAVTHHAGDLPPGVSRVLALDAGRLGPSAPA
jgi:molybdate transport system ATP-binding protein